MLSSVQGQHIAQRFLENYLRDRSKLPPLLLFTGPDGVGKYSMAEIFSQHLLCQSGVACGTCASCRIFLKNQHPDFIRFPVGQTIKVGDSNEPAEFTVRWLQYTRVLYRPHFSSLRIVLIPDAGLITNEAETAFLKTLEEAPYHTRFIFLVNDIHRVKPTIASRAVEIPFQYLPISLTENLRNQINEVESQKLSYGGSMNPFDVPEENFLLVQEKVNECGTDEVQLLHLESWIKHMKESHKDWTGEFHYTEFLDLVVNVMILNFSKKDYEANIPKIESLLHFKKELHRNIGGYDTYLISHLFFQLS